MATHNPDTLQRLAKLASSEFGRWYEEDYFPSHEEISHASGEDAWGGDDWGEAIWPGETRGEPSKKRSRKCFQLL